MAKKNYFEMDITEALSRCARDINAALGELYADSASDKLRSLRAQAIAVAEVVAFLDALTAAQQQEIEMLKDWQRIHDNCEREDETL